MNIKKKIDALINPVSAKADVKRSHIIQLMIGLALIILINVLGNYFFFKLDLTQEKRFTLSDSTKELLKGGGKGTKRIEDKLTVRCYLGGDVPAGYKELRNSVRDLLNEFRSYNSDIEYEFIDPNDFKTNKDKGEFYEKLFAKGFSPLLVQTQNKGKQEQQNIFPYAEIAYQGRTVVKTLISTKTGLAENDVIKSSIQNLEYTFYSSISSVISDIKPNIAFLYGQGELKAEHLLDIIQTLGEQYSVDSVTIDGQLNALVDRHYDSIDNSKIKFRNKYDCLIIAKPEHPFNPKDLYVIDQYVMHGGKVLWLMDPLSADMDSLQNKPFVISVSNMTGAEDMLFYYGIKLNNDLVLDMQCVEVPIVTGQYGDGRPQMTYYPWNFFPSVVPNASNIITDKINPVKFEFVSSIDTVANNGTAHYTPLLYSSVNTRLLNAPVEISLQMLKQKQDPKLFNQGRKTIAVLAEGKFASAFRNRLPAEMLNNPMIANKNESDSAAMIVISDGDIIKNNFRNGQVVPLGYDIYTNQMFGNKEFLINCIDYLSGNKNLIPLRSREVIVRKLDVAKAEKYKLFWQLFNIILPLLVISVTEGVLIVIKRRKYISK